MASFRSSVYAERYEYVKIYPENGIVIPGNGVTQIKEHRFVCDGSNETTPYDVYNGYFEMDFSINYLDNAESIIGDQEVATVNDVFSFISSLKCEYEGMTFSDTPNINMAMVIKNLLNYSSSYSDTVAQSTFFYPDTGIAADSRANQDNYSVGFADRHVHLFAADANTVVRTNVIIPLNRYGLFETFRDDIMPNGKLVLNVVFESDNNIIFRTAQRDARLVVRKLVLWLPKITFNTPGRKLYLQNYLQPKKITYYKEVVNQSSDLTQTSGNYKITSSIRKPKHVFIVFVNADKIGSQLHNMFLFDTYRIGANNTMVTSCQLEVQNGIFYPESPYKPLSEVSRMYHALMRYGHCFNDYLCGSTINMSNFVNLFPIIYFDLRNSKPDVKSEMTKLSFSYTLSGAPGSQYKIFSVVLHEEDLEIVSSSDKVTLRN